eukprot:TRINITY_DN708_c0_g2_i2.p1 TRINITY_DN708_c0_g2~~TRINITY_DN708_c0_g2_i2.p1  ORF type:complete len:138 (+),score=25.55 TRINITY_DN708_c0_g2_i2:63-416(+)
MIHEIEENAEASQHATTGPIDEIDFPDDVPNLEEYSAFKRSDEKDIDSEYPTLALDHEKHTEFQPSKDAESNPYAQTYGSDYNKGRFEDRWEVQQILKSTEIRTSRLDVKWILLEES